MSLSRNHDLVTQNPQRTVSRTIVFTYLVPSSCAFPGEWWMQKQGAEMFNNHILM